jgi:hypothetical protein
VATFAGRRGELDTIVENLTDSLEKWVGEQPEGEARAAAAAKGKQEQDAFDRNVRDYSDERDRQLTTLIDTMRAIASAEADPESIWATPARALAAAVESKLGTILTGNSITSPTPFAVGAQWGISSTEKLYADGLLGVGVAPTWKAIQLIRAADAMFLIGLEAQWNLLKQKSLEIYRNASPYATRIADVVENSPGGGVPVTELSSDGDDITALANKIAGSSDSPSSLLSAAEGAFDVYRRGLAEVERFTRDWQLTIDQAKSDVAILKGLQAAEIEALHRVFKDRRKEAQEYHDHPSHENIDRLIDDLDSRWNSWAGGLPAPGMKKDSDELIIALMKPLSTRLEDSRAFLKSFEDLYDGIFLNAVDAETVQLMCNDDDWDDLRKRFIERRAPDVLMTIKAMIERKDVDANELIGALEAAVTARTKDSDSDRQAFAALITKLRGELVPRFAAARDALRRTCDDGYTVLAGSELAAVMDRREVLASVKST